MITSEENDRCVVGGYMVNTARPLEISEVGAALAFCAGDPIGSVAAAARLEKAQAAEGFVKVGGGAWRWPVDGPIEALCWAGGNLMLIGTSDGIVPAPAINSFVKLARQWGPRCSSIVGRSEIVLPFWRRLAPFWPRPREIRDNQPLLAISNMFYDGNLAVAKTSMTEIDLLIPACVEMFTEELGYSPLMFGAKAYRDFLMERIAAGYSYRLITGEPPRIEFKAEVGAAALGVAQLQGIWIPPDLRGRSKAKSAIAAVIKHIQKEIAPTVSLYVNRANNRALHIYQELGFNKAGTFATVLF